MSCSTLSRAPGAAAGHIAPNCPRARLACILRQTQMVAALSSQYEPKMVAKMQKSLAQRVDEWVEKRDVEIRRTLARDRKDRSAADRPNVSQSVLVCAGPGKRATDSESGGGATGKHTDVGTAADALSRKQEADKCMDVDVSEAADAGPAEGDADPTSTVTQTHEGGSNGTTEQARGAGSDGGRMRKSINDVLGGGMAAGARKAALAEDASKKAPMRASQGPAAEGARKEMTGETVRVPSAEPHPKRNLVSRSPLPCSLCPCVALNGVVVC